MRRFPLDLQQKEVKTAKKYSFFLFI